MLRPPVRALLLLSFVAWVGERPAAQSWTVLQPERVASLNGSALAVQADGSILAAGPGPATDIYTVECVTDLKGVTGFRLEALPHDTLPRGGSGRHASGDFVLSEIGVHVAGSGGRLEPVELRNASASFSHSYWPVTGAIDGQRLTGWAVGPNVDVVKTAVFEVERGMRSARETRLTFTLELHYGEQATLGCFRLAATTDAPPLRAPEEPGAWGEMQARINAAIDRGVAFLIAEQELDGSWAAYQDQYRNGQTALALYTLLKQNVPAEHQSVRRAIGFLRTRETTKTYSAGCLLLALCALDDPEYDPWIERLARELVSWQTGGFGYPESRVDLSNTQFGALGLWAAARRGVKVPQKAWKQIGSQTLMHAEQAEGTYDPAGFSYVPDDLQATGGMTAAGVALLVICEEMLGKGVPTPFVQARKRGFEWLARNFSASREPLPRDGGGGWVQYYLYGIERVGALTGERYIGASDWYREGARHLVDTQMEDGSWAPPSVNQQANTCFALLFLSRATAPTTGPVQVRGGKNYGADVPTQAVSLRATGDTPLRVWVSSFGQQTLDACEWPGEEGAGPRVAKVEYVTPGGVLVPDATVDGSEWRTTTKRPAGDWTAPEYDDGRWSQGPGAFGIPSTPGAAVRTDWRTPDLWLRRTFTVPPAGAIDPFLVVQRESTESVGDAPPPPVPLLSLYDEDAWFPYRLTELVGQSVAVQSDDAFNGRRALRVEGLAAHSPRIAGWNFEITRKPKKGEFRYIRFAWKKIGGEGIGVQLAKDGQWADGTLRYYAGENESGVSPAVRIDRSLPEEWTVVTRDLYKDFGGEAVLTGIAFLPVSGQAALFDAIYLARSKSDFGKIPKDGVIEVPLPEEVPRPTAGGTLRIHLNGEPLYEGHATTTGYETLASPSDLREALRPGENVLAVHCQGDGVAQVVDVGIRDRRVLGVLEGDVTRPSGAERYAIAHRFDAPGTYPVSARVHVLLPDGETLVLESAPLAVQIDDALDQELLAYASDPGRNLLLERIVRYSASSEYTGWLGANAIDNLQARGWLASDDDPLPTLTLEWEPPLRADTLLLSHARPDRLDPERTSRIRTLEVRLDEGPPHAVDMSPDPERKTVWRFPRPASVSRIDLRVVGVTPGHPTKVAVGLAEVELQLRK